MIIIIKTNKQLNRKPKKTTIISSIGSRSVIDYFA